MKLVFIHDHPFFRDHSQVYSGGSMPASLWNNYLSYFDNLEIIGRNSLHEKDKQVLSSGDDRIQFSLINKYTSIKNLFFNYSKINQEITDTIAHNDIVLVRLPSVLGFIGGFAALRSNKTLIVEQVGNAKEALSTHKSIIGKIGAPVFHKINQYLVKRASYVVYVTERKLQNDYRTKARSAAISDVLLDRIMQKQEIEDTRFYDAKFKIGLIGTFDTRYKGQEVLLKAVQELPGSIRNNIELYFAGKGDYSWLVEKAKTMGLNDNIKFVGSRKAGRDIFNFLKDLTLYVQPSFTEGMPRAMLEAMSMGCPVLASEVGGIPDLLDSKVLHKAGDHKKLSQQIETFYNDRCLLKQEALSSIEKAVPYLKENLDAKRKEFNEKIIERLNNA